MTNITSLRSFYSIMTIALIMIISFQVSAQNQKWFEQQFKKNPDKILASIERNIALQINRNSYKLKDLKHEIKRSQQKQLKLLKLVKTSHPKFYKDNLKRLKDENWYKRYLKSRK